MEAMMSAGSGFTPASGDLGCSRCTGIGAHNGPEWVLTINRNECSRCAGIRTETRIYDATASNFPGGHKGILMVNIPSVVKISETALVSAQIQEDTGLDTNGPNSWNPQAKLISPDFKIEQVQAKTDQKGK